MSKAKTIDLKDLDPKQLAALKKQVLQEQRNNEKKIQEARKGYKASVNKVVPSLFQLLQKCSHDLAKAKEEVYKRLSGLVVSKSEVYDREQDQTSHSFSTEDGITISIGYRQNDGWDDTVEVGIQKVTDYMQTLSKDDNSKSLVKMIMKLLAKDSKGLLKASRVLQLKKIAEENGNKKFIDAIQIIQDAYRPARSKQFVTCRYKNSQGETKELPLNISDVDLAASKAV